jgi:flagellar protein FliT
METGHPIESTETAWPGWHGVVSAVIEFYQLTNELIQFLEESKIDRDEKIRQIDAMLSQRDTVMDAIIPPYTSEEIEAGKEIIQLNIRLSQLLQIEKASVQKDIKSLKTKKETNTKYVNPYQNLSTDGMFYDKRK